jgi:hypothetical protein
LVFALKVIHSVIQSKSTALFKFVGNFEKRTTMFVKLELSKAQIPVGALSKEWVYGRSLAGIAVSSPAKDMVVCYL